MQPYEHKQVINRGISWTSGVIKIQFIEMCWCFDISLSDFDVLAYIFRINWYEELGHFEALSELVCCLKKYIVTSAREMQYILFLSIQYWPGSRNSEHSKE